MRDIALVAAILGSIPIILRYPFAGILFWSWISIAVPHQEAWGFSTSLPLNLVVAVVTIGAWLASPNHKLPPQGVIYWAFMVFLIWVTFNSLFAYDPAWSWNYWDRCWKTILLGLMAAAMATTKVRLHALMWVIVVSLFYYGVKGGVFTLMSGGHYHVFGPPNSYIGDNNCLALALLMTVPLANYLRLQTQRKWLAMGILAAMGLTIVAIIGSYSRGALLGMAAVVIAGLMRMKHRFVYIGLIALLAVLLFNFMPHSFHARMDTLSDVSNDASFQGRVTAWQVAYFYAVDHFPFGAGFYGPQLHAVFHHYFPTEIAHAAHSIYFQVLGEHGFIGLAIYLVLIAAAFVACMRICKAASGIAELGWVYDMASMIEISLVGFCVGGAALSLAYYDVFVLDVAILLPLSQIVRTTVAKAKAPQVRAMQQIETAPAPV